MKKLIFIVVLLFSMNAFSQIVEEPSPIKWYTIEQAMELNKKQARPLFIDFYTDWCGWCKRMMQTTFTNKEVVSFITNNFYPVRFDAETKDTIKFRDTVYVNNGQYGKAHSLAYKLLGGRLSYPTIVYIDREGHPNPVPGFMKPEEIIPLLVFFSEDIYKNSNFKDFERYFKITFLPANAGIKVDSITSGKINWLSATEAFNQQKIKKKKIFVDVYTNMYISNNVMDKAVFTNPTIASILNQYYYCVRIDAASQDTVIAFGQTFVNGGKGQFALHPFAATLMQGKIGFPTLAFIDEDGKLLNSIQGYTSPEYLEPILMYFYENKYVTEKWEDFRKTFVGKIPKPKE